MKKVRVRYWLLKSEPDEWSWSMQVAKGTVGEPWTGVRNYQARNLMKEMQVGDLCFFYHSGKTREIVGVVEVMEAYQPDPTDVSGRFGMVVVAARDSLQPISLQWIKNHPDLQEMKLLKQSRLSVQPVTNEEWNILLNKGQEE